MSSLFFDNPQVENINEQDFVVNRLVNYQVSPEGNLLPPLQAGEFLVPFVSGLQIIQTINDIASTTFTLTWNDIETIPGVTVDHYNIYYKLLGTNIQAPIGPFTAHKSPAQITISASDVRPVTFFIQTVLTNGMVSDLDNCTSTTGYTGIVSIRGDRVIHNNKDNLAEDPSFERHLGSWFSRGSTFDPLPAPPSTDGSWSVVTTDSANSNGGTGYVKYVGTGGSSRLFNIAKIECRAGDQFYAEVFAKTSAGATGNVYLNLLWYNAAGTYISSSPVALATVPNTSYAKIIKNATITGAAAYVLVELEVTSFTGTVYFDDVYVRRIVTSEIVNLPAVLIGPNGSLGVSGITWTNNSPTSTSVAWSAGIVSYRGITYPIAAGSSGTNSYIYWQLSSPTSIQSSAAYPTLGDDDFIIGINGSSTSGGTQGFFSQAIEVHNNEGQRTYFIPDSIVGINAAGNNVFALTRSGADPPGAGQLQLYDGSGNRTIFGTGSNGKIQLTDLQIASGGKIIYDQAPGGAKVDAGLSVPIVVNGTTYYIELFS